MEGTHDWAGAAYDKVAKLDAENKRLREALIECRRLAEGSKDDFMNNQYKWLDSIYAEANRALSSEDK